MKIAVISCYDQIDYIRARTLRSAFAACPDVTMLVIKNKHKGLLRYIEVPLKLLWARLKERPAAYVITFRGYEILPLMLLMKGRRPLIFDEYVNAAEYLQEQGRLALTSRLGKLFLWWYTGLLRRCTFILADTEVHAEYSAHLTGIDRTKYIAVPVGTDELFFKPDAAKHRAAKDGSFRVFYYGVMTRLHGLNYVLDAAVRLSRTHPKVEFIISDPRGDQQAAIEAAVAKGARITRHSGWVPFETLPRRIIEADLCLGGPFGKTLQSNFVIATKTYQFLACAAPALIGANKSTEQGFIDKKNCLLVPQGDAEAIARTIGWAADHPKQLRRIARAGRRLYEARFSAAVINQRVAGMVQALRSPLTYKKNSVRYLQQQYRAAQRSAHKGLQKGEVRGEFDPRHAAVELGFFPGQDVPHYMFLLNRSLLSRIEAVVAQTGRHLTEPELARLALANDTDAVEPQFSPTALNAVNAAYFGTKDVFKNDPWLANLYGVNISLNYALGALLATAKSKTHTLRIKELGSGSQTDHWQFAAEGMRAGGVQRMHVTLTDFVHQPAPKWQHAYKDITVKSEVYNLFDVLPKLPAKQRYDAIIATYGFDSVWLPGDAHYTKVGEDWYQTLYRVKIDDWQPKKDTLMQALKAAKPLAGGHPLGYDGIFIECVREKVDMDAHPYGAYIKNSGLTSLHFPAGLITRVVNAFATQLTPHGIFISADVSDLGSPLKTARAFHVTGVAARYKVEAYSIAKAILEREHHVSVSFMTLPELMEQYMPAGWQSQVPFEELPDLQGNDGNGLLIVRRKP